MPTNTTELQFSPDEVAEYMRNTGEVPPVIGRTIANLLAESSGPGGVVMPYEVFENLPPQHVRPFDRA